MKNLLLFAFFITLIFSCGSSEDDATPEVLSSLKEMSSFKISNLNGIINSDDKTVQLNLSKSADLSALSPTISISDKATVSPASDAVQDFTNPVTYTLTAEDGSTAAYTVSVFAECASADHVHAFTYDGKNYELIKLNRNWDLAASCAVERGGYLAEINDANENTALFNEISTKTNIDPDNTIASDGGSASYIWLGANDLDKEGSWYWDGDNDGTGVQFWEGDASGMAVDDLFSKWGNEPDDSDGQDGLGLGITQWPISTGSLGSAGQWNDIDVNNQLYFLIEYN